MFSHIARFEWRYQLKSPVFWVGSLLFFLLAFGATTVDTIQIGSAGNVNLNSPFAIVQMTAIMGLFGLFVVVAMVAGAVIRDDETGFAPILRSTRLRKGAYLGGRFIGAVAAALVVMATVPLAIALGAAMPWQDAEKIGPFVPTHYLYALFVFALPTLLVLGAGFFALATATRSMMWTYVGAVAVLVGLTASRVWLRNQQLDDLAALADPFGLSALSVLTKYWTAADRNTLLPPISGALLHNRLLWTGIAAALFALAYAVFRFESRSGAPSKRDANAAKPGVADTPSVRIATRNAAAALPTPRTDRATRLAQLWALARFDAAFVFRSPAFFVLLFIGMFNAAFSLWTAGDWYGSTAHPVTRLMVQALIAAFSIMPIIIAIYYAGELVWRDRDRRMHEIVDATAAPDWTHLLPKVVAIAMVLAATAVVGMLTAMAVQAIKGHVPFELGAYLRWWILPTVIGGLQLALLSVFVQVLVPQKYIGWGVMLLQVVAMVALGSAGFEHNLYIFGGTPPVPLSDMNGMGRFWIGAAWFQLYWSAFAALLGVAAFALWRRGTISALRARLADVPRRLRGGALAVGGFAAAVWVATGGWIFYNTNVLNLYQTSPEREAALADAEKELIRYEKVPMPHTTAVALDVQLYPKEARAVTTGRYRLENRGSTPLSEVHLTWNDELTLDRLDLPGATLEKRYERFPYSIYRFATPMQPGEVRELRFATTLRERGFRNAGHLSRLAENGTFLDNNQIAPSIGLNREAFLKDRAKRRKHGLPADLRAPTLEDASGRERSLFMVAGDWVDADITVTTDADQVPIAPGTTVSDTTRDGRRTVRFKTDAPINHFFSIQSGRYDVLRDQANDVALAVYHHPGHDYNAARMMAAMKSSLALFSAEFSPYQFKQARILEFPSYADFAQSFANTIPYSENLGFLTALDDSDTEKIDVVTYVTAHEIAHQWWGHQLLPSHQQGATLLVESLAQYSALLVMERTYGKEQMRKFLKYELDRYLRQRGGEAVEEVPLARVEDQPHIHYQKGSLVLYWLKEAIGEDKLNKVLAQMLQQYAFQSAPYPNTTDFLRLLRAEAGPAHDALITDLFEKITLLDLKATDAKSTRRADGRYEVSVTVEARKLYADGQGRETEAPMDEVVEVGVFTAEPGRSGYSAASVLSFDRQRLKSGKQTVTMVVDKPPVVIGVDPYNKRIDRNSEDNFARVAS